MSKEDKKYKEVRIMAGSVRFKPIKPSMPYTGHPGSPENNPPNHPAPNHLDDYPGMPYTGMELARAYIPIQRFGALYDYATALEKGTLFPDLYRPYPY